MLEPFFEKIFLNSFRKRVYVNTKLFVTLFEIESENLEDYHLELVATKGISIILRRIHCSTLPKIIR